MKYILALDQGTTSSRAIVFDHKGEIIGMAQEEFAQIYPKPGWVEHEPKEILSSEMASIYGAITRAGITFKDISAISITKFNLSASGLCRFIYNCYSCT